MKTLYILNKPSLLSQCQSAMSADDGIILVEDAVVIAAQDKANTDYYVLEEDLIARGLTPKDDWNIKDYEGFVELTLAYDKTVSWL
ncbi:hypothetical protein GCM10009123_21370 [Kangiella japonica]|uniref:tRNA 2-thiouridine synthesizing protein B n=1 Tax=Kangiella japonica TaxID=647384 RepID=A0ABP3CRS1_9GAMM